MGDVGPRQRDSVSHDFGSYFSVLPRSCLLSLFLCPPCDPGSTKLFFTVDFIPVPANWCCWFSKGCDKFNHTFFLPLTVSGIRFWSHLLQSSLLVTLSGQCILRILLKELLIKVCNLRVTVLVTFHVQQPHNSTNFTLLSKILNFIHLLSCWDTYICISCAKTPFASLSFVLHLHLSHLLWKPKLPRHWNCSTCLMTLPLTIRSWFLEVSLISFILLQTHFLSFSAKFFYLHTC